MRILVVAAAAALLGLTVAAQAQTGMDHSDMDHSGMMHHGMMHHSMKHKMSHKHMMMEKNHSMNGDNKM